MVAYERLLKRIENFKSGRSRLREVPTIFISVTKSLAFWISARLQEVVAYERWLHREIQLHVQTSDHKLLKGATSRYFE